MEKSCGTITIKDNKVLMVLQNLGHMSFPKGHVEEGETEEETALRETYEETGIIVRIIDNSPRYTTSYPHNDGIKEVVYYMAEVVDDSNMLAQESEIKEVVWQDIDKVRDSFKYENAKLMWDEVLNDLKE